MNPSQLPGPGGPAPGQNPYDFITGSGKPPKKPLVGGSSVKSRLLLVGGGLTLLVILVIIFGSILNSAGSSTKNTLRDIAKQQIELIRVASAGTESAQTQDVRILAYNTSLSVSSSQQQLSKVLSSNKIKLTKEELAGGNSKTDQALSTAKANNHFDEVFTEELTNQLQAYQAKLQAAYKSSKKQETKDILSEAYTNAARLLGKQTEE